MRLHISVCARADLTLDRPQESTSEKVSTDPFKLEERDSNAAAADQDYETALSSALTHARCLPVP